MSEELKARKTEIISYHQESGVYLPDVIQKDPDITWKVLEFYPKGKEQSILEIREKAMKELGISEDVFHMVNNKLFDEARIFQMQPNMWKRFN